MAGSQRPFWLMASLDPGALGSSHDGLGLLERVGHGLLQQHVLACLECLDGHLGVPVRRQRDINDLDTLVVDDVVEAVRMVGAAELAGHAPRRLRGP